MRRNNRLSDSDQSTPTPPGGFTDAGNDFVVNRTLDGHDPWGRSLDNNVHSPGSNSGSRGVDYGDMVD